MRLPRIETPNTKHAYDIEVAPGTYIEVWANTRTQAASIARKAGHEVRSVNMVG